MIDGYTKSSLENRVAQHYEEHYAEIFPSGGTKRPVSIKDLEPMLLAFAHRIRGEDYSKALKVVNDIDIILVTWGHYQRLVDMRMKLENDDIGSRLAEGERGYNLGQLGVVYFYMGHRQNAELYLTKAESIAKARRDKESEGSWLIFRALNAASGGDLRAAKKCLDSAKDKVKGSVHKAMLEGITGLMNLGVLGYYDVMHSANMLKHYNKAVELYDKLPISDLEVRSLRAYACMNRARGYAVMGQLDAAIRDLEDARAEFEALDNSRVLAQWNNITASVEREMGKLGQAKSALEHAQRVSVAIGEHRGEQVSNSLLGKVYRDAAWAIRIREGKFTEAAVDHLRAAAHHCEIALKGERQLGNRPRLIIALRRLGNVSRDLLRATDNGKDAENLLRVADESYDEALSLALEGDARAVIYDWLERTRLALAAAPSGRFPDAQAALNAQQDLVDKSSPLVVPPVELVMGIVLLRNEDAYQLEKHDIKSPKKAFDKAEKLLAHALSDLAKKERGSDGKSKDLKRRAEIGYALETARVGLALSADKAAQREYRKRTRKAYEELLGTYTGPGFVRDTVADLIAIRDGVGSFKLVDDSIGRFSKIWHPDLP